MDLLCLLLLAACEALEFGVDGLLQLHAAVLLLEGGKLPAVIAACVRCFGGPLVFGVGWLVGGRG